MWGEKYTPLGEFGVGCLKRKKRGENGTCIKGMAVETFENLKVTQLVLQVYQ